MTSIVGSIVNGGSGSSAFTLTNGSASGRAVVVLASQSRNPVNLAGADFSIDSVGPSQTLGVATGSANGDRTLAMIWNDADLPATGGGYTLASTASVSTRYSIYELSDADTTTIEVISAGLASGFADPLVVNFTTTNADSILFLNFRQGNTFGSNVGTGDTNDQTVDNVDTTYYIGHEVDTNADAQMSIDGGINTGGDAAYTAIAINSLSGGGPTGPTLNTIPATAYPGETITLGVTGAEAVQGAGGVTINGVTQTISSWSDTSIDITVVQGDTSYGTGKTVELTNDSGGTDTGTIELVADTASGFGFVDISSPNASDESSVAFGATPTVVTGDQFEWEDFNTLGNLVVDAEGFVSSVDTEGTFRGRFWDATDSTWGAVESFAAAVEGAPAEDNWPFGLGIQSAATKNWEWGKRHPMTNMRVRIYK